MSAEASGSGASGFENATIASELEICPTFDTENKCVSKYSFLTYPKTIVITVRALKIVLLLIFYIMNLKQLAVVVVRRIIAILSLLSWYVLRLSE